MLFDCQLVEEKKQHQKNQFILNIFNFIKFEKKIHVIKRRKYAIRSILYLAMHTDEQHKVGVKKIAEDLESPQPFLAKLLQQLNKGKLVSSTKGPNGGFYLSKSDKENAVWDIIKNIDGNQLCGLYFSSKINSEFINFFCKIY